MIDEKVLIERLEEEIFSAELHDYGWEGQTLHNLLVLGNVQVIAEDLASEHNNGWISVEDALPEYTDDYNVTVGVCNELGYYECVKTFRFLKIKGKEPTWDIPKSMLNVYKVIAWQPLPAPYKKGE